MPEQTNYDPGWDTPERVAWWLKQHPPTLGGIREWLKDAAEATTSPMARAWYLQAATLLTSD